MLRHLYLQFYIGILGILVIFVVAFGFLWRVVGREARLEDKLAVAGELLTAAMPPATASHEQQRDTLEQFRDRLALDLSIYAPDSTLIASAGRPIVIGRPFTNMRPAEGRVIPNTAFITSDRPAPISP